MAKTRLNYDAMRRYKAEGHTGKEVAEKFGCSRRTAAVVCKGIAPQWKMHTEEDIFKYIKSILPGFEYVDGFTSIDGYVSLQCSYCKTVVSRSMIGIRHGNGVKCPVCAKQKSDELRADRLKIKHIKSEQKRIAKEWKRINKGHQLSFKVCIECGVVFVPSNNNQKCCSSECSRKRLNRKKDNRINRTNLIDKDITLTKLYNRDNGRCYICGRLCDWNDKVMDGNGNTIVGESYPTIEHIYPLSKGGKHSWSNVKLACFYCNTMKGDSPLPNYGKSKKQ